MTGVPPTMPSLLLPSGHHLSHPRTTRLNPLRLRIAGIALLTAAAIITSGLTAALPAAATTPSFLNSFESADLPPEESTPHGQQTNVTGRSSTPGSLLSTVNGITASAENAPNETATNLADNNPITKWLAYTPTASVTYNLSTPAVVREYRLTSANDSPPRDPRNFVLEGSHDGAAWTVLDTRADESFGDRFTTNTYSISNETAYASYRLSITAVQSGTMLQLASWDILDGSTTPDDPTPMITEIGTGPTIGYNMKPSAGFSGTHSLRYAGSHIADGAAAATNKLFEVNVAISSGDELSYKIFPDFDPDLKYAATYSAVDFVLDDGRRLSELGLHDGNGFGANALSQGTQKALYASQWNSVRIDLTPLAGRSIRAVLFSYNNPDGSAGSAFSGWLDDISVAPAPTVDGSSLVNYVDTRRGTLSSGSFSRGNNIPATAVPNGFNFFTPMTNAASQTWLYEYAAANNAVNLPRLQGIGISHEPSPWMGDRNQLAIMPSSSESPSGTLANRALEFDHKHEIARPDLYSVKFTNGIATEVTPTDHGGIYRFQFTGDTGSVLVDQVAGASALTITADGTLSGWVDGGSGLSAGRSRMFISGQFDQTPSTAGSASGNRSAARYASFDTSDDKIVELRLATSFISLDQAAHNLDLEVAGHSFDTIRENAQAAWNKRLGVIEVEGASAAQLTTLYSNLYRMNLYPNSQFENTGSVSSPVYKYASPVAPQTGSATETTTNAQIVDGKIYVNNGFWDTYRTAWPAYSLLYPELEKDLVDGFIQQYRDGGWVARWSSPGYADLMTGTSSDVAFADAYLNGALDTPLALETYDAALKNATVLPTSNAVGRKGLDQSTFLGYTPASTGESVSWGLEGLINDEGIGQMAAKLADDPEVPHERREELREQSLYFLQRARSFGNLFDPTADFFQSRNADGSFLQAPDSFNPLEWGGAFTETNGWNFAFHAPFDIEGLSALYGGQEGLINKLDTFFATPETATHPGGYGSVIHEMIEARDVRMGQLGMSNQVSHHIPYMYAAAGQPAKTQEIVREILQRLFVGSDIGQGYAGDEDNGETSAWYVFSALGFYPTAVGTGEYVLGSPLFTKATVHLKNGRDLVIEAPENSAENVYVQSVSFDGNPLSSATIPQETLTKGGTLRFNLGPDPSSWGNETVDATERVPLVDATAPAFGTTTVSDNTPARSLSDDNSRSSVTFNSETPTIEWASASGPVTVTSYTLTNGAEGGSPSGWTLSGSADGSTWIPLDQRSNEIFTWSTQTRPFQLEASAAYTHYRLSLEATSTGTPATLAEIELLADPAAPTRESPFVLTATSDIYGALGVEVGANLATLAGGTSNNPADYTATVDFLDGAGAQPATLTRSALGAWRIASPYTFTEAGTYSVQVTATEGLKQASTLTTIVINHDETLLGSFDNVCIADPGAGGNCDEGGYAFPRSLLADSGFVQGQTLTVPGTALTADLPDIPEGHPDNATGRGQTIHLNLGAGATQISVIGTGTQKNQQATGTLNFTDGTSTPIDLSFGDWAGAARAPLYGNIVVGTSPGRLAGGGDVDGTMVAIFATAPFDIPQDKTVASLTMPNQPGTARGEGRIHVFAIASDGTRGAPDPLVATSEAVPPQTTGIPFEAHLASLAGGRGNYRATVHWGDGTATDTVNPVDGRVHGSHSYEAAGDYTVTVTANDGEKSTATTLIASVLEASLFAPELSLSPGVVSPGDVTTVSGIGFAPGENVEVMLSSTPEISVRATTDPSGAFNTALTVPSDAVDGAYPINAIGDISATAAYTTLIVQAPPVVITDPQLTVSTDTLRPGDTLIVNGTGYAPGEQVNAVLHSTPITLATITANGDGVFSASITIPVDTEYGDHTLVFTGLTSNAVASVVLKIVAELPADVGTGPSTNDYRGLSTTGAGTPVLPTLVGGSLLLVGLFVALLGRLRRRGEIQPISFG
ncbi:GH92 family glycosyl hydrolase [Lysinibacter sp. HNR]|uniref:GH92 family glycosyl hydrolase n=1 Tax=Lysinibacter sp. HNR TaxID=3031408 RepID=UPI0024360F80|nr:GH92 family glycosyl hydrolase [Lysinibacter sp. HNR]WGD38519.1 GH92 family glycosyl hydrolase [Lysinibacter sp. HNR]